MESIRNRIWPRLLRRARHSCEACGKERVSLDYSHIFGRPGTGAGLGAWANTEELTAALCRECHNKLDRHLDDQLAYRMRLRAVQLLAFEYAPLWLEPEDMLDPTDQVRHLIREIESDQAWVWTGAAMERAA